MLYGTVNTVPYSDSATVCVVTVRSTGEWFVRGCAGIDVHKACLSLPGLSVCLSRVCLSVTPHFLEISLLEGYLRG